MTSEPKPELDLRIIYGNVGIDYWDVNIPINTTSMDEIDKVYDVSKQTSSTDVGRFKALGERITPCKTVNSRMFGTQRLFGVADRHNEIKCDILLKKYGYKLKTNTPTNTPTSMHDITMNDFYAMHKNCGCYTNIQNRNTCENPCGDIKAYNHIMAKHIDELRKLIIHEKSVIFFDEACSAHFSGRMDATVRHFGLCESQTANNNALLHVEPDAKTRSDSGEFSDVHKYAKAGVTIAPQSFNLTALYCNVIPNGSRKIKLTEASDITTDMSKNVCDDNDSFLYHKNSNIFVMRYGDHKLYIWFIHVSMVGEAKGVYDDILQAIFDHNDDKYKSIIVIGDFNYRGDFVKRTFDGIVKKLDGEAAERHDGRFEYLKSMKDDKNDGIICSVNTRYLQISAVADSSALSCFSAHNPVYVDILLKPQESQEQLTPTQPPQPPPPTQPQPPPPTQPPPPPTQPPQPQPPPPTQSPPQLPPQQSSSTQSPSRQTQSGTNFTLEELDQLLKSKTFLTPQLIEQLLLNPHLTEQYRIQLQTLQQQRQQQRQQQQTQQRQQQQTQPGNNLTSEQLRLLRLERDGIYLLPQQKNLLKQLNLTKEQKDQLTQQSRGGRRQGIKSDMYLRYRNAKLRYASL